ncbi:MAG: GAF domain-containing protein [Chloroflexi bacterium]|nr:GAF domain-containing protein [Chloroflexota bacterium]
MGSAPATEKSRSSRLSLGVRLTLLTLTLVLIPLFLIAGGAYLRAADLLKNQTNPEITAALSDLAPITIGLVVAATLLILILVPLISRRFLRPLDALITFSERLAAGDLKYRVSTNKNDEIGRLAQSLNHMADELNEFYMTLEARVLQRTKEIRLAAEMARDAAASRDVDQLFKETLHLISDKFTFYHSGIFMLDDDRQTVQLKAASSEGGRRMLNRGHSLPVGKTGLVGYATDTGETRLMQRIGEDPHYFANPDLPETQSEIVLPLIVSGEIIGALDVQSRQLDAFSEADVLILQIIADQLAVALENTRLHKRQIALTDQRSKVIELFNVLSQQTNYDKLVEEIPNAIRESFGLSRVTLGLVEGENVVVRSVSSAESALLPSPVDTSPIGQGVLGKTVVMKSTQKLTLQPLHELETQDPRQSISNTILAIPLIIRDKVIGSLAFESGSKNELDKDEIEALEIIASQTAFALENVRLFEEMQLSLQQMDSLHRQQTASVWAQLLDEPSKQGDAKVEYGFPDSAASREDPGIETSIELRGEVIGNMALRGIRTGEWSQEDRDILKAVADELANALEQTRLLEEINRRVAQLQTAAEIARSASSLMDLDSLLERAVSLVQQRFNFYHVSIYLISESGSEMILYAAAGSESIELNAVEPKILSSSNSVVAKVVQSGKHFAANDTELDPDYGHNPLLPETRSELGIPLKIGASVIGVFDVHHDEPHAFSDDTISVLRILADQVAIAVQNVRLFEQTYLRAERKKSVVSITSRIRETRDVDSMLQTALSELHSVLGAQRGRIQLTNESKSLRTGINAIE